MLLISTMRHSPYENSWNPMHSQKAIYNYQLLRRNRKAICKCPTKRKHIFHAKKAPAHVGYMNASSLVSRRSWSKKARKKPRNAHLDILQEHHDAVVINNYVVLTNRWGRWLGRWYYGLPVWEGGWFEVLGSATSPSIVFRQCCGRQTHTSWRHD